MNKGKIMRKLLGQPLASSESVDTNSLDSFPQLRPSASQNTIYSSGAPTSCLDRSPDGQRAVIAGANVFKVLNIDGSTISEDVDLGAIISSHATTQDVSATADQLNIKAVKWSHDTLDTTIITACANGRIIVYDLNRPGDGFEVARIQEHARQVHKLDINPFRCNLLLSASQDGTVKSFDIRSPIIGRSGSKFRTWQTFKCNADAVRDVQWSPADGFEFACSTDAGVVQKWDIRKPSAPVLKFTAHQSACFSISWHPDGEHLVSGGIDQHCHVWDFSKKAERGQKPRYSFATPAPVSKVCWRPACWSATAQGQRSAQLTVSYDDSNASKIQNSAVHIWDLARSAMPFKEIEQWASSPTGLLWHTQDLLWSVDRDGQFFQTDVAFVPRVIDRRSLSNFSFSSSGDVLMLLEERHGPRRSRPSINAPEVPSGYQHSSNGPLLSISRSDSEEDVVGSFLGLRRPRSLHRRHSGRSSQSLSTTPPTIPGMADSKVMSLDDSVKVTGTYKSQQVMAIGHAPSTSKRTIYQYFSNRYLERMAKDAAALSERPAANDRIIATMEYYARSAQKIGHYRLAQTWRLLAYTMNLLLIRRAEHHRQVRLTMLKSALEDSSSKEQINWSPTKAERGEETPRKRQGENSPLQNTIPPTGKYTSLDEVESTSNVATPLVRPVRDNTSPEMKDDLDKSLVENDILELPEAAHSTSPTSIPVPGSNVSSDYEASSVEGYDFYGIESFSPAIEFAAPQRKWPLRLEYSEKEDSLGRMQPVRHDSGESFQMFSTSGDSQADKFMSSSGSDIHSLGSDSGRLLRERAASWENSTQSHPGNGAMAIPGTADESLSSGDDLLPDSLDGELGMKNGLPQTSAAEIVFRIQEPSLPSAGDSRVTKFTAGDERARPAALEARSNDPNIIESDFLPWPNEPDFLIKPIDPTILTQRSITFETQSSVLNASAMVLLLRPLLPPDAIDEIQAAAILRQYHNRLTSMKIFTEATLLRNLCVPLYPTVFGVAQENVTIGYFCTDCQKPLENDPLVPGSMWRCPRCHNAVDGCAVCRRRDTAGDLEYDDEDIAIDSVGWWSCPGCGHGGHTACMHAWHAGPEYEEGSKHSGGSCPLEGCLHPCLPGSWRDRRTEEKKAVKAKELDFHVKEHLRQGSGRGVRGVRKDAKEAVQQSKAVEGVRAALAMSTYVGLEKKKSVKFAGHGEEDD